MILINIHYSAAGLAARSAVSVTTLALAPVVHTEDVDTTMNEDPGAEGLT